MGSVKPDGAGRVWLCRPGIADDPCISNLDTTVVEPDGSTHVVDSKPAANPPIDCFYVYPTVTPQHGVNANLRIDPEERNVATDQASRFSQDCRVFAPMYRQVPIARILAHKVTSEQALTAYLGVRNAFADYLAHYNHGRGFVLIGHSQGASILIALLRQEIDPHAAIRKKLVSAIVLGGNLAVANQAGTNSGYLVSILPCASAEQTGCVVAYSSFAQEPPKNSYFGRIGQGLNPYTISQSALDHVLCVNPTALGGGSGVLDIYLPAAALTLGGAIKPKTPIKTPWVAYPGAATAECESKDGANWLQVSPTGMVDKEATTLLEGNLGPRWGLHVVDVNLALGNLVALVRTESLAYRH